MATYNTAFGSLPGYNEMLGTTNTTGGGQQQTYNPQQPTTTRPPSLPAQTFAQLQKQGMARPPAPTAPAARPMAQYGGSQQAQDVRNRLQQQLTEFSANPSRFNTQAFQQVRGAQAANLQSEFQDQQKRLNEDLARRGISASNIAASGLGRLEGAQSRALATLDSELLQRLAETFSLDQERALTAGRSFAEMASQQDMDVYNANLKAQQADFENQLAAADFAQKQYLALGDEALNAAKAAQDYEKFQQEIGLKKSELAGTVDGQKTVAAQQLDINRQEVEARASALISDARLKGRELDLTEARNLAEQEIERERLVVEREKIAADKDFRSQQLGLDRGQLELRAKEIAENSRLRGLEIDNDKAYREAEIEARTTQIQNEFLRSGQQIDVDKARIQAQQDIAKADRDAEAARQDKQLSSAERIANADRDIQKLQSAYQNAARLSEQSGVQYTVDANGVITPLRDAQGNVVRTSEFTQTQEKLKQDERLTMLDLNLRKQLGLTEATGTVYGTDESGNVSATGTKTLAALRQNLATAELLSNITGTQYTVDPTTGTLVKGTAKTFAAQSTDLDRMLRQALGMSDATGYVYDPITGARTTQETVQGQVARNQMFLTLAQLLQNSDLAGALRGMVTTPPPFTTTQAPFTTTRAPVTTAPPITGTVTTAAPTTTQSPYNNWNPTFTTQGDNVIDPNSLRGTPVESYLADPSTVPLGVRFKVGGYGIFYDSVNKVWRAIPLAS